ncbi:unnamed protein product, partial [Tetraodon nigroviridis]
LILLPLEAATGVLYKLTDRLIRSFNIQSGEDAPELLSVITDPLTTSIIELDKSVINDLATGDESARNKSLIKFWCKTKKYTRSCDCSFPDRHPHFCLHHPARPGRGPHPVGGIFDYPLYLPYPHRQAAQLHAEGPGGSGHQEGAEHRLPLPFQLGYRLHCYYGIGVISLERAYPLTLGSNIGTTTTSILAAMASPGETLANSLQIALCHFFFNIFGIVIWYPLPFMRIPIRLARALGNRTAKYRWFAVLYLILCFLVIPLAVFGLSMAGWIVMVSVGVPIVVLIIFVIIVNVMQPRWPRYLPKILRSWDFLPRSLHSLAPWDAVVTSTLGFCSR